MVARQCEQTAGQEIAIVAQDFPLVDNWSGRAERTHRQTFWPSIEMLQCCQRTCNFLWPTIADINQVPQELHYDGPLWLCQPCDSFLGQRPAGSVNLRAKVPDDHIRDGLGAIIIL